MEETIGAMIQMAENARLPWRCGTEIELHDDTTQAQKDFCLERCPYADCSARCERCAGDGKLLSSGGRPRKEIDIARVVSMRETMTLKNISLEIGVSTRTIIRALAAAI